MFTQRNTAHFHSIQADELTKCGSETLTTKTKTYVKQFFVGKTH